MAKDFRDFSASEFRDALNKHGGERGFARHLGVPRTTIQYWRHRIERGDYRKKPSILDKTETIQLPSEGNIGYVILTSAQDQTRIFEPFWKNLVAYAEALGAQILVSGYTYNKSLFEDHRKGKAEFHPALSAYMTNHPVMIGHSVRFCGEVNILPTAVNPLSGYDSYTGSSWGIFPHPKLSLKSIPVMPHDPPKVIMTTGSVTEPNFIQKNAGIKAEFHHSYGAILVPFDDLGNFFSPRHLLADETGSFYDLDAYITEGRIEKSDRVEAITWGDIHIEKKDHMVSTMAFGIQHGDSFNKYSIRGALQPRNQFLHDVIDFRARNHHTIDNPVHRFLSQFGKDRVEDAFDHATSFLVNLTEGIQHSHVFVVYSNHTNEAMLKWLMNGDHRKDPENALFFLKASLKTWTDMYENGRQPDPFNLIMREKVDEYDEEASFKIAFLQHDSSVVVCPEAGGGIECALHGHLGANGAKAAPQQFARTGRKSNTAHTHSPGIYEGNWCAGHTCERFMGYNKGLTSWAVAHIIVHANGKRQMIFQDVDGAWTPELPSSLV